MSAWQRFVSTPVDIGLLIFFGGIYVSLRILWCKVIRGKDLPHA